MRAQVARRRPIRRARQSQKGTVFFENLWKGDFLLFIKTQDGNLINSRYIVRIYIAPDKPDDYQGTDVIAEMSNDADFDETLATFDTGDLDYDLEDAGNFVRSLENKLNCANVFVSNHILPVANCGG